MRYLCQPSTEMDHHQGDIRKSQETEAPCLLSHPGCRANPNAGAGALTPWLAGQQRAKSLSAETRKRPRQVQDCGDTIKDLAVEMHRPDAVWGG